MKKKKRRKFPPPAAILYYPAAVLVSLYMRIRYRVTVDKSGIRDIKGPALVLANHLSDRDHFLVGMALLPHRATFVLSAHFWAKRFLRPILSPLHVITKRMFDSDAGTVLNMMRAARDGRIIVLFPEGRLTWTAHSMRITEGTAELVRKLRVDVYRVTPTGASLTFPKWGRGARRGRIMIETEKLLSADEIPSMSKDEIFDLVSDKLRHDDEVSCRGIKYSTRDTTAGLDGILYKCPSCGAERTLTAGGSHIKCASCGMDAVLSRDYVLTGAPFDTVGGWYDWQYANFDISTPLSGDFTIGSTDEKGYVVHGAGEAHCTLDREKFTFDGTLFGEHLAFELPTSQIPAVPITVGKRFDIYHDKTLLQLSPIGDPGEVVRWAIFFDKLADERLGTKGK